MGSLSVVPCNGPVVAIYKPYRSCIIAVYSQYSGRIVTVHNFSIHYFIRGIGRFICHCEFKMGLRCPLVLFHFFLRFWNQVLT